MSWVGAISVGDEGVIVVADQFPKPVMARPDPDHEQEDHDEADELLGVGGEQLVYRAP